MPEQREGPRSQSLETEAVRDATVAPPGCVLTIGPVLAGATLGRRKKLSKRRSLISTVSCRPLERGPYLLVGRHSLGSTFERR